MISYHFPPSAAIGGQRIVNFAKNLPLFGFETSVLTVKEKYIERLDAGRLKDVESIKITRTGMLPQVTGLYPGLKALITGETAGNNKNAAPAPPLGPSGAGNERITRKLRRYVKSFIFLPDGERNWVMPAVYRAARLIRRDNIDCILTSCPPYSVHLIGLYLKTLTGVKWIADFRDPWMIIGAKRLYTTCKLSLRLEKWIEKKVIKNADMVLFNTRRIKDAYVNRYSDEPAGKFVCILNGFDPGVFSRYRDLEKYDRFTLSYTGSMYVGRTPEPIFMAIKKLISDRRVDAKAICIKLVGDCRYINGRSATEMAGSYGLDSIVEVVDTVPYHEALDIISRSHLAMLFAPNLPYQIPAKVYDYIGVGTRILALAEEGATADLVDSTGAGKAFDPSDIEGITEFIYQSITHAKDLKQGDPQALQGLEVEEVTKDLARQINRTIFCR